MADTYENKYEKMGGRLPEGNPKMGYKTPYFKSSVNRNGSGIGAQPEAAPTADPLNNIGKPINAEHRERANKMLKSIGIAEAGRRYDCVTAVAGALEKDEPHTAMEKAMGYIDLTGSYRLFAELLA